MIYFRLLLILQLFIASQLTETFYIFSGSYDDYIEISFYIFIFFSGVVSLLALILDLGKEKDKAINIILLLMSNVLFFYALYLNP